jgi:ATP-dependent helicase/nuclease subunit A
LEGELGGGLIILNNTIVINIFAITMFKIVSSSAGSGKTYTLTKEYLKLALKTDKSGYFRKILAITFTKAATREMKERITQKLQAFADGQSDPMLNDIVAELGNVSELQIRARSKAVFTQVLHNYSDFSILTIDSFMQRIVSAFTEELGLPFQFEVEMEVEELLKLSVERMLEKVGDESFTEMTQILKEYYLEASEDGNSFQSLPQSLADFARNIVQEQSYAAIEKNKDLKPTDFRNIRKQLKAFIKQFENHLSKLGNLALDIIDAAGLVPKDFSSSTVYNYFKKSAKNDRFMESLGKLESAAFNDDKGWYTKTAKPFIIDSIENIKPELQLLFEKIEDFKTTQLPFYVLYESLVPHLYQLAVLNEIKAEFDRQLRDNGQVHISEFNRKIMDIVSVEPVPFIYERLGEKYNHILVDEFQDTSKLQFANLLPLIDNSLSYDNFNLAVGDSKQAIYRFRGGDMDQIIALHTQQLSPLAKSLGGNEQTLERLINIKPQLVSDALVMNRRSAAEIVEFNNDFFEFVANQYIDDELPKKVYDENFKQQLPPNVKRGGQVKIEFVEKNTNNDNEEEDSDTPAMVEQTLTLVQQAVTDGFELKDIAVLCRKKYQAKQVANALKDNSIGVISEDSLSLKFSAAVNLVSAFMQVLVRPDNKLYKYEALYLFFRVILQKIPNNQENSTIKTAVEGNDVRVFYDYVNELLVMGHGSLVMSGELINSENGTTQDPSPKTQGYLQPYKLLQLSVYELAEKLITVFALFEIVAERDYLFRFLDVVLEFGTRRAIHLSDFIAHWDIQKDKVSISSTSDSQAVTVQTIHKSKGLEYPVVIVPYADWQFTPDSKRDKMWVDLPRTAELITKQITKNDDELEVKSENVVLKMGSVKIKSNLVQTPEEVLEQYQSEKTKMLVENMNLLYVALTRPTKRLYILASQPKPSKDGKMSKISHWLSAYVGDVRCQMLDIGNDESGVSIELPSKPEIVNRKFEIANRISYIPNVISSDRSRDLRLRRQAERIFDVETFEVKKEHGNKVHYALSLVKTGKDIQMAINRILAEGLVEPKEAMSIQKTMNEIVNHPALVSLFLEGNNILNEREILTPDGKQHRPDRVVQFENNVVILDYKTGIQSDGHKKQIQKYKNLYQDMGYQHVEAMLVYIERSELTIVSV